jgi:hypothetical protein
VKVEASTLSVDTQLEWQPNLEPDLAGYEIVYRDNDRTDLDAHHRRRQRDQLHSQRNHQGQLPLRRSGNRSRRERERRQLPGAEVGTRMRAGSPTGCPRCLKAGSVDDDASDDNPKREKPRTYEALSCCIGTETASTTRS